MSEVAGRMAPQVGSHFLEREHGGRGVLLGGAPGVRPARVVVLGAGNVGWNAAWIAQGMEAEVLLLDSNLDRLRWVDQIHKGRIMTLASNRLAVERAVADADLVIGAVLVPGGRAPVVVTDAMVRVDATGLGDRRLRDRPGRLRRAHPRDVARRSGVRGRTACCTTRSATSPARCRTRRRTRSTNATLPYALALATRGRRRDAVRDDPELATGVNTADGAGHEPRGRRRARARRPCRSPTRCRADRLRRATGEPGQAVGDGRVVGHRDRLAEHAGVRASRR